MAECTAYQDNDCDRVPLPQPLDNDDASFGIGASFSPSRRYRYLLGDEIADSYFPSDQPYDKGMLCWVLKSKGRHRPKSKKKKKKRKATNDDDDGNGLDGRDPKKSPPSSTFDDTDAGTRTELFLRARVVSDVPGEEDYAIESNSVGRKNRKDRRVTVRYPKGSTYRVKRSNLIPVLEPNVINDNIVLVTAETPDYRRAAAVHTCVGESFLEIGCDFGPTVDRVKRMLTEVGDVPMEQPNPIASGADGDGDPKRGKEDRVAGVAADSEKVICLGIDKSKDSIDIAVQRFPGARFSLEDALTPSGATKLRKLCKDVLLHGCPSVVAIDINGTRELPAVLQCIANVLQPGGDVRVGVNWTLPRLIIVKSRSLHAEIKSRREIGLPC